MLTTDTRPIDKARASRAFAAWWTGDKAGMDAVMVEVIEDDNPEAGAALVFAILDQDCTILDVLKVDQAGLLRQLRRNVAYRTAEAEQQQEPGTDRL